MHSQTLTPEADDALLGAALEHIGEENFLPVLLQWARAALGASDGSLIRHGEATPELTAAASVQGERAQEVGDWYMRGAWYRLEPNLAAARLAPAALQTTLITRAELPDARWREQYERTGLAERLSLLVPMPGPPAGWVFVNAYRPEHCPIDSGRALAVLQRQAWVLAAAVRRHLALRPASPFEGLSVRERQVIDAILAGASAKEAARELGLSPTSIATYRQRAFDKLGIHRQVQLFQLARR